MKFKILKEAYTNDVIDSYLKDVYNAYDRLRDCLYALDNSIDGLDKLENSINMILINLEDDFYPYMKDHLDDIEDYINPQEEEEDEEIHESINNYDCGKWDNGKFIPTVYKDGRICLPKEFWERWDSNLNEEFTVGEIYSNGKAKFKILEPTKDGKIQIMFDDKDKTIKSGTSDGLSNMIKKNNYVKESK